MKFSWCTITVGDLEESIKFYQEVVGLTLMEKHDANPDRKLAFLGEGETKIELIWRKGHKSSGNITGISLGFEVDSVDEKIAYIHEKGIKVTSGPSQPVPQVKFFFVKDPNGVNVQFIENM